MSCEVNYTSAGLYFTKEMNLCNAHAPILKVVSRYFNEAGEDEALKALAWDRSRALWQNVLDGEYAGRISSADPVLRHRLLREQAAFNACLNTRAALYAMLYPEDELTLKELCAGLVRNKAMEMCK